MRSGNEASKILAGDLPAIPIESSNPTEPDEIELSNDRIAAAGVLMGNASSLSGVGELPGVA
jgi:hypothetical protein